MTMRKLSEAEIAVYLDEVGEAVTTSVGAYQLERLGMHLFERSHPTTLLNRNGSRQPKSQTATKPSHPADWSKVPQMYAPH
jgi:hypothetical protein